MTLTYKERVDLDRLKHSKIDKNVQTSAIQRNKFCLEIDRLFFCVQEGREIVSILQELGFYCPNTIVKSDSQGTLSKIFFFHNIYLAIVWIKDNCNYNLDNLQTGVNFSSRANWRQTKASPFGIGLSRKQRKNSNLYWEQDLIKNLVVDNNIYYSEQNQKNLLEPFVFLLPDQLSFRRILNLNPTQTKKFINHPLGVQKITDIKITAQKGKRRDSDRINLLNKYDLVTIDRAIQPLLELTFDKGIRGKVIDIRPILPIIIKY